MKGKEKLISHLLLFEKNRKKGFDVAPSQRQKYANAIAKCFMPCAEKILAGCFRVENREEDETRIRFIRPTAIELYYHEEGEGRFKDPIMYHTNDRKSWTQVNYFKERCIVGLPYYPIGCLNPHTSGIDITFENPKRQYRASFLIREYEVEYETGKKLPIKNSTEIYDDLLLNGITLDRADWIKWCDGGEKVTVVRTWRKNVPNFRPKPDEPGKWEPDPEGHKTFATAKGRFAKCPFNWQFRKKQ